ncbi:MAG: Mo-dependent nitrogenase C-terminal domain-containing protein [Leptolyngbya sp. Prado105]|jgi:hypothetical protein|nr:Mo-dependent nitrogenase C-terminal domain-containing protein [Leptolyngbya sp. Prado105]
MTATHPSPQNHKGFPDLLFPLRRLINNFTIRNHRVARLICKVVPCACPFERDVALFGRTFHIPALCKLNPLYTEVVLLRFRALSYLTDVCEEDVAQYLC